MKRVVIILVALVGLASGAAYFVVGGGDEKVEAVVSEVDAAKHIYINLPAIGVTMFRDNRPAGRLIVVLALDVHGVAGEAAVRENMEVLHDAYFRTLHSLAEQMPADAVNVDVDLIKSRIMGATRQIVEPGRVREVLVQNAFIQRRG